MKYLAFLAILWPFVCSAPACEWMWACAVLSTLLAASLFVVLSLLQELQLLSTVVRRH